MADRIPSLSRKEVVILEMLILGRRGDVRASAERIAHSETSPDVAEASGGEFKLAKREMYGLEMVEESGGALKRGTVYVTTQRMEDKKLITSRSEPCTGTESGPPRRLYSVTALGEAAFQVYQESTRLFAKLSLAGDI